MRILTIFIFSSYPRTGRVAQEVCSYMGRELKKNRGKGRNRIPGHSYPAGDITGDCIKEKDTDINEEIPAKPKIIQNIRKGGQPGKMYPDTRLFQRNIRFRREASDGKNPFAD